MTSDKTKFIAMVLLITGFLYYSFYIYTSLPVKTYTTTEESGTGKIIWQQYNCSSCHQVYGLGGYLGPDLTNTFSLRGTDYIKAFLMSGTTSMPNFHLTAKEINALLAYLACIDATGKSDPKTFTINKNGTIEQ
jgi:nitric oxide reductase subunit C